MVHSPQHFITLTQLCKCALTACLPTLLFLRRTCQCWESIKIRALLIVKIVFRTDMRALKSYRRHIICICIFDKMRQHGSQYLCFENSPLH